MLRLTGLDVLDRDAPFRSPCQQLATNMYSGPLSTLILPSFAALLDDPVQAANNLFSGQGKIHFDAQACAIKVIQQVQQPECPVIAKTIRHEVNRPCHARRRESGLSRFKRGGRLPWSLEPMAFHGSL